MSDTLPPLPSELTGMKEPISIAAALQPRAINLNLGGSDRDGVLRELVTLIVPPQQKRLTTTFFKALKAREDLCPTCVNGGVALPHARNALLGVVDHPTLAYGRHRVGVAYGALDGLPVRHFFLLCAPSVRDHLQLLARVARLVNNNAFRLRLDELVKPDDMIALVQQFEKP